SNLTSGNLGFNIFVWDSQTGGLEIASVSNSGTLGVGFSFARDMDADGSVVTFESTAENLVADDANGDFDAFVRDRPGSDRLSVALGVGSGEVIANLNFGTTPLPGEIHGRHFFDLIPNGVADPGEPGLAGTTVYLDANNNGRLDA